MKVEKYYCDVCNKCMLPQIVENMTIQNKKYDLCNECKKDIQEKVLNYMDELKHIKIMKGGE